MLKRFILAFSVLSISWITSNAQSPLMQQDEELPRFQTHYVRDRETPSSIAQTFHITLKDFLTINDFPTTVKLKPGEKVLIRKLKKGETVEEEQPYIPEGTAKKETVTKTNTTTRVNTDNEAADSKPAGGATTEKSTTVKTTTKEHATATSKKTNGADDEGSTPTSSKSTESKTTKETTVVKPSKTVTEKVTTEKTVTTQTKAASTHNTQAASVKSGALAPGSFVIGPDGVRYDVSTGNTHVVQKRQNFYRIAIIYGLSMDQLKQLNNITSTTIVPGQELRVRP